VTPDRSLAVIGLGRVGLPLALCFADRGIRVLGVDHSPAILDAVRAGRMPFAEAGTQELLDRVMDSRSPTRLELADRAADAAAADDIVITIGTPSFSHLESDLRGLRAVVDDLLPLRRFFDADMPVGGASDWGPKNAWEQIQLSLTHEFGESGFRNLGPNQRISRLEALSMMTSGAAQVMHWDDIGSLAEGCHADFVVIDRDPIACPVEELHETKVLQTVFAGDVVYDADQSPP